MEINQDLQSIRSEICDWAYFALALCGIPAAIVSVLRVSSIGWHWTMAQNIVAALLVLVFVAFRKRLSYTVRAGYLVALFWVTGTLGLWQFGLLAAAIPMLVISPVLVTILFGLRAGIYCVAITLSLASLIAIHTVGASSTAHYDAATYIRLAPSWFLFLMIALLCMVVPITAIIKIERHLTSALILSGKNRQELEQLVITRTEELEKAKQNAESLARTDSLTGINNRRAFYEIANMLDNQARRSRRPYSALMIDLDFFKAINDNYGHDSGDSVLVLVSELIVKVFRSSDVVGRVGGEEFGVMLPDTELEDAQALAEKLRNSIRETAIQGPKGEIRITASVGVAMMDDKAESFEQVMSNADNALYQAKRTGRNRVCCYEEDAVRERDNE